MDILFMMDTKRPIKEFILFSIDTMQIKALIKTSLFLVGSTFVGVNLFLFDINCLSVIVIENLNQTYHRFLFDRGCH